MRPLLFFLLLSGFLCGYFLSACSSNTDEKNVLYYPEPRPDSIALTFLPGIVSTDSTDFNAAFSPDGKSFYFTRSKNKKLIIYRSVFDGEKWKPAKPVSFNEQGYSFADPAFSPEGKLFFISDRPRNSSDSLRDYDIWFVDPLNDSSWSSPVNATILNSDSSEYYVSFARNGNLYFSSSRAGGFGQEDIYVSRFAHGNYERPENLGSAINTAKTEYDPGISPDEDKLVFTSRRDDGFGGGDLYFGRREQKQWLPAVHLSRAINTDSREYCSSFSPDSKYFFFTSQKDVKWIGTAALK